MYSQIFQTLFETTRNVVITHMRYGSLGDVDGERIYKVPKGRN